MRFQPPGPGLAPSGMGRVGESGKFVQNFKAKNLRVEGNRFLNVVNHVADTYHVTGVSHVASPCLARRGCSIGGVKHGPQRPAGLLVAAITDGMATLRGTK